MTELSAMRIHFPQNHDSSSVEDAICYLTGETDLENVPEYEMERFWDLLESPVAINLSSRAELEGAGLLSHYQTASLLDYISRSGDVMSVSELAAVDGFGMEMARSLSPFISFESSSPPGRPSMYRPSPVNSLTICNSVKWTNYFNGERDDLLWNSYAKYKISQCDGYDAGFSLKRNYDDAVTGSGYVAIYGKRRLARLVAGNYALRFGQGLALWTGFSMSGLSGPRSFWKRPSGVSPSRSCSGESNVTGIAAEFALGKFEISSFIAFPGLERWIEDGKVLDGSMMPGVNASWYQRHGQLSMTIFGVFDSSSVPEPEAYVLGGAWTIPVSKVSADARFSLKGMELFGEAAFDIVSLKPSATCGVMTPFGEYWKYAIAARWIPDGYDLEYTSPVRTWSGKDGETGISAGVSFRKMEMTIDLASSQEFRKRQVKLLLTCPLVISDRMQLSLRLHERLRAYDVHNRTDIRADLKFNRGPFQTVCRANAVISKKISWLAYLEEGLSWNAGAMFLRGTAFMADSWDDRLYCYERDVPGNFNVPAYYGRGYSVSFLARFSLRWTGVRSPSEGKSVAGWKGRSLKLYFRAGWTSVPWKSPGMQDRRPSKAEARLQAVYGF